MFSPRTLAIFALLAVATAGPTTVRQAVERAFGPDIRKTFDLRRTIWDHYDKQAREAAVDKILFYEKVLDQCWVEVTDNNYRVIINVDDNKKDDLRVTLNHTNNAMIVEKTVYEEFNDAIQNKKILSKSTFYEVRSIPANSVVASVTATVTSNGYLVVDFPIDAKATEPVLSHRVVPVVESGKPLEGGKVKTKHPTFVQNYKTYAHEIPSMLFKILSKCSTSLLESKIEDNDDNNIRVIVKLVKNITKNGLTVELSNNYLHIILVYDGFEEATKIDDPATNFVCNSYILPQNIVAASVTAMLTDDDYLVVDIPIDAQAEELALSHRFVPVVECGKPLEKCMARTAASASEEVTNNENDNDKDNENHNDNENENQNDKDNQNEIENPNENEIESHDDNANENDNDNENQNNNENENENQNNNENENENQNNNENENENHNDNEYGNDSESKLTT